MAPQLKNLYVYEGPGGTDQASFDLNAAAVFNAIADYAKNGQAESNQVSCSWYGFDGSAIVGALVQMNMDGQSVFISSGDNGAYVSTNPIWNFITNEVGVEYPYGSVTPPPLQGDQVCIPTGGTTCFDAVNLMTVVGGTQSASTTGTNTACVSETVWDDTSEIQGVLDGTLVNGGPSGGGISQAKIPTYQPASLMTTTGPNPNNGSTTNRNIPDVAALADAIWTVNSDGQQMASGGTSAATPLWAGFAALVHEQRANATPPLGPIGLFNPYLYNIGPQTAHFTVDFHDILSGTNNPDASDTAHWSAVPGYDLTTGWGTPRLGLISDLASPAPAASPILYDAANFIIQTGNDDLRCTSTATVDLLDVNGNPLQSSITLHSNGQDSWSGGSTHTVSGAVSPPQPATAIAFVRVNFFQGSSLCQIGTTSDNWNIAAITVDLSSSSTGTSRTILLLNFNPQVRLKDHGNGQAWTVTWSAKFACPVGCFEGPSCGVQSDCPSGAGACIGGDGSSGDGSGCCIDTSLACGCNGDCASGNCVGGNGTCGSGGGACE
jgi:subtilase family serine protease